MGDYSAWLLGAVSGFRKPLGKDEYLAVGLVAVLGTVLGATIGYIAVPRWDAALVVAMLSLPGGLFAGALAVLLLRRRKAVERPTSLRAAVGFLLGIALLVAVYCATQSIWIRITCLSVVFAVMAMVLPEPAKRPSMLRLISGLALGTALIVAVHYTISSTCIQTVVLAAAVAVIAIVRRVTRPERGDEE
jgi:hypothetical protein